jgi:tetratricopeptide (TPR) repeat protein
LGAALAILCLLVASMFSKESGVLFVPLLLFMELVVFRGEKDGQPLMLGKFFYKRLVWLVSGCGVIISILCLPMIVHIDFPNRDFDLVERLMTEARVLFYYLRLFFIPSLSELALFHDDFVISTGLLKPASTALSFLGLAFITVATLRVYKAAPLWWFAWGWFLLSHMLESTVIGLELVHEHRNYFATLGFVLLISWLAYSSSLRIRRYVFSGVALFLVLSAFTTWQRADLWGNPYAHAAFEAEAHPQSWRSHFQMGGQFYQAFYVKKERKYAEDALEEMYRATHAYKPENMIWIHILMLDSILGKPVNSDVMAYLKKSLQEGAAYNSDNFTLSAFADRQMRNSIEPMPMETIELFAAAIENPKRSLFSRSALLARLAAYYLSVFKDVEKTEEFLKEAIALHEEANYHMLLVEIYIPTGRLTEAEVHLEQAIRLDKHGIERQRIAALREQLQQEGTDHDVP